MMLSSVGRCNPLMQISSSTLAELPGKRNSGKTVSVTLHKVDIGSQKASSYLLIIEPEASQDGSRKKRPADESSGCDLKDLNALSGCYITAELTNSFFSNGDSQVFEVGDDKTYGGYRNKPLAPGYNYKLHQGVTIKLSDGESLHKFLEPVSFFLHAAYATIPECSSDTAENRTSYEEVDTTSIPTNKLQEYIKDEKFIRRQFQRFGHLPQPVMSVAELPTNKSKNRYRGTYPEVISQSNQPIYCNTRSNGGYCR
ncbi:hypothetical protein EB796_011454 [Bugula neritina]|uniref:Receptor-type tyrosine-protein phosphatase U-like Fn3 domain-containing protein n=1 Tax=Bugula neritina TaxID=10212 RepID=A0A7J7JV22_BUGNE|nr:hypothetical protein EB796_011454 [Bugula neritina]